MPTLRTVSEQPSEFLTRPPWRTRARPRSVWIGVAVTFAAIIAIGIAVLGGAIALLRYAGAPAWVGVAAWVGPTVLTLLWAVFRPDPATASEDEAQPWSDYAVRAVMIGVDEPRPVPHRVITGVVFGGPLLVYLTITVVLEALGLF